MNSIDSKQVQPEEESEDPLELMLRWLKSHLANHVEHREPKGYTRSINGTDGWAVVAIPDWDVRQKIEMLEALLVKQLEELEGYDRVREQL